MCGINLIASGKATDLAPPLHEMMRTTSFRGPDARGTFFTEWQSGHLALGANRLRVINEDENADQPMVSDCGNYILAYNGEIFNYHDLKTELLREGQRFITSSDTEVLLYWLKNKGAEGIGRLKGMYAFVFVDVVSETIIAARDSHGIKPLFYYTDEEQLIFSSSLKAITRSGLVAKEINQKAVSEYLSYRHVLGVKTFYAGINAVKPGYGLVCKGCKVADEKIPMPAVENPSGNLKEALIDAMTMTTASQSAGLFLSGGVDSTLLLAIYRHELGLHGMPTFTLNTGDDAKWAEKAAKQFNASHHQVEINNNDVARAATFLDMLDQPIADHGALATWLIAEKAGVNHRVMLAGAGADELFAGYNRHRALASYLEHKKIWLAYKTVAKSVGYFAHPGAAVSFLKSIGADSSKTFNNFLRIYGVLYNDQKSITNTHSASPVPDLKTALEFDRYNYLVNDVLAITDLATMAHGIETRVPYLYDDVVAIADQIPSAEKIRLKGKGPLKELLAGYGGKPYTKRRKMGFGLPIAGFMRDSKFSLWSILQNDDPVYEYVSQTAVSAMKSEHLSGKKDWNMQLWSILVLSHWLKSF